MRVPVPLTAHVHGDAGVRVAGVAARVDDHPLDRSENRIARVGVRRVFRRFERDLDMALGGKVVNFIRLRILDDPNEVGSVRHVPVVHGKAQLLLVRILIKMIDPPGIERGRAPLQAMNDIALVEQEFGKVRAILPGDSGNQCNPLCHELHPVPSYPHTNPGLTRTQTLAHLKLFRISIE